MEARFLFIIGEGEERAVYTHFCRKLSKDSYTIGTLRWRQRYWR